MRKMEKKPTHFDGQSFEIHLDEMDGLMLVRAESQKQKKEQFLKRCTSYLEMGIGKRIGQ